MKREYRCRRVQRGEYLNGVENVADNPWVAGMLYTSIFPAGCTDPSSSVMARLTSHHVDLI